MVPFRQVFESAFHLLYDLTDDFNPLADFAFDKLPTELLVEIFKHAHPSNSDEAYAEELLYPVTLTQVCHHWRTVALGAPTLWANIQLKSYTEEIKEAVSIYLERSKTCPLFLTWFSKPGQTDEEAEEVVNGLIIPCTERWQRITLITDSETIPALLLAGMRLFDFPILQDFEITCPAVRTPPSVPTLCRSAPFLRRCRFRNASLLPPPPSNLVVFDCMPLVTDLFSLELFLEFLPHVAHSLEHLRFGPPTFQLLDTPHRSRIPLQSLQSLIVKDCHTIMDYILVPNLTYFSSLHPPYGDAQKVAEMFNSFSAPKLQSIQFHRTPLLPLLTSHDIPSMFPQLESVALIDCTDESAFSSLLQPPQPKKPSSLQKASKCPQKHRKVDNPLPHLKELTVSDMQNWTSLQAAIEKRLKNGDKSLRKIQLPKEEIPDTILRHLTRWLPKQGIELVLYESGERQISAPPAFQDDSCNELSRLFSLIVDDSLWGDDYGHEFNEDYDYEYDEYDELGYWDERQGDHPDYEPTHDPFYEHYDDFDDEEEEDEDEEGVEAYF